jgi:plasmid stability protein
MIQIRDVPEDLHRRLKSLAALQGMSLSDYLKQELQAIAEMPTIEELAARIAELPPVDIPEGAAAEAIRKDRDSR